MALHRRSTSLPCVSRRPLLHRTDSDISSILQTRAPPEDRLPIFTGRKAWETWTNLSPSTRARIERQNDHNVSENDRFGAQYPESVINQRNDDIVEGNPHQHHTGGSHDTRGIHPSVREHDTESNLATIGSFSRLSLDQHVLPSQSSIMSPISVRSARRALSTSPERSRSSRNSSPKGITALHSYNRSPSKSRSPLRQTVTIEHPRDGSDVYFNTIEEDTVIQETTPDKKKSFPNSLGSLWNFFASSSEDKMGKVNKIRNTSVSPIRTGRSSNRIENLSPRRNRERSTERAESNNRGRTFIKTLSLIDGLSHVERGRSRNTRNQYLQTSSRSNHNPSIWRSLSCYSSHTLDMSDTAKDANLSITQARRRSCSTSHLPVISYSSIRESPSGRRHKHHHRYHSRHCRGQTMNISQKAVISSSAFPLQHDSNCEIKDVMRLLGSDDQEGQPRYIHYHLHYVMSGRRSVSNHT